MVYDSPIRMMRLAHFHPLNREIVSSWIRSKGYLPIAQERFTHVLRVIDQVEANLRILFSEHFSWILYLLVTPTAALAALAGVAFQKGHIDLAGQDQKIQA